MEGVLVCTMVVGVFIVVFSFLAFRRFLHHREVMALAEKGLAYPEEPRRNGKETLRWGIIITAVGLALIIGLAPLIWLRGGGGDRSTMWPVLLIGLLPTFFGVGLILVHVLTRDKKDTPEPTERYWMGT